MVFPWVIRLLSNYSHLRGCPLPMRRIFIVSIEQILKPNDSLIRSGVLRKSFQFFRTWNQPDHVQVDPPEVSSVICFCLPGKPVFWFWEEGYHGEEIFNTAFFNSKLNYIHANPVRAGIVEKEEEYLNSSAGDFYGVRKGPLN